MTKPYTLQALARSLVAHGNQPSILAFHQHRIETWSFRELSDTITHLASGLGRRVCATASMWRSIHRTDQSGSLPVWHCFMRVPCRCPSTLK